jgi:hypothetical protein
MSHIIISETVCECYGEVYIDTKSCKIYAILLGFLFRTYVRSCGRREIIQIWNQIGMWKKSALKIEYKTKWLTKIVTSVANELQLNRRKDDHHYLMLVKILKIIKTDYFCSKSDSHNHLCLLICDVIVVNITFNSFSLASCI